MPRVKNPSPPASPGATEPSGEPRRPLTSRQKEVLDLISESLDRRGYPPTLREIGERLGIRSTNGVNDHLIALTKKGYLERQDLKSRALRVMTAGHSEPPPERESDLVEVPLLGRVAAGQPILAQEHLEDRLRVDRLLIGNHRELFALRVQGDSMIDAGINDGDFVFVRKQPTANPGDIVVAMINEEATVKYFYPEADRIAFKPANSRLSPIYVRRDEFRAVNLLGTVVGLYRRFSN